MRRAWVGLRREGRNGRPTGSNAPVCGRKFCADCGRWRHLCDFGTRYGKPYAYCHACDRRQQRERYRQRTKEQQLRRREYERIWREVKRRERGVPARTFQHRRTVVDHIEHLGLPLDPLLGELEQLGQDELATLARRAKVSRRAINRYLSRESHYVRIDVADRLALALGKSLFALYEDTPAVQIHSYEARLAQSG